MCGRCIAGALLQAKAGSIGSLNANWLKYVRWKVEIPMKINTDSGFVVIVLMVLLAVALIAAGPLLILWSLNTLFPALDIPYTIWTWVATVLLGALLSPTVRVTKRD